MMLCSMLLLLFLSLWTSVPTDQTTPSVPTDKTTPRVQTVQTTRRVPSDTTTPSVPTDIKTLRDPTDKIFPAGVTTAESSSPTDVTKAENSSSAGVTKAESTSSADDRAETHFYPAGVTTEESSYPVGVTTAESRSPEGITAAKKSYIAGVTSEETNYHAGTTTEENRSPSGATTEEKSSPKGVTTTERSYPAGGTTAESIFPAGVTTTENSAPAGVTTADNSSPAGVTTVVTRSTATVEKIYLAGVTTAETVPPTDLVLNESVSLTTETIENCFQQDSSLEFRASEGQMSYSGNVPNTSRVEECSVELISPIDTILVVRFSLNVSSCNHRVFEMYIDYGPSSMAFQCSVEYYKVSSHNNRMRIEMVQRQHPDVTVDLFLNFTSVPKPQLELIWTSPSAGFVQNPTEEDKQTYPKNFDGRIQIEVPANQSLMISFPELSIEEQDDCGFDSLKITFQDIEGASTDAPSTPDLLLCDGKPVPKPAVYPHVRVLSVHFVSDSSVQFSGFRMQFSFHSENSIPAKTASGLWNCSVLHWPDFKQHVHHCNLHMECLAGEDESNCSHIYRDCTPGNIAVGDRCYVLVTEDQTVTWNEAANACLRRGGYLASLNSAEEWDDVMNAVADVTRNGVYFGLQSSGPSFPELYQRSFQWSDDSAVYYFQVTQDNYYGESVDCSYFTQLVPWYNDNPLDANFLTMVECNKNVTDTFLCEKHAATLDTASSSTTEEPKIASDSVGWSANNSHVVCSAGHVTLTFLACDVKSECFASSSAMTADSSASVSCDAPVTPLPPSFTCDNGLERVPYTLVCDHRTDCSDNSDENFCVFPACPRSEKFQCSNKQCVSLTERCDGLAQCQDSSDERQCPFQFRDHHSYSDLSSARPPAIIRFDGHGLYNVKSIIDSDLSHTSTTPVSPFDSGRLPGEGVEEEDNANATENLHGKTSEVLTPVCPETHFWCPGNRTYCMPVFVRCNGVYDCPGREDEAGCDSYTCPGFYRCRASPICVHADHVCDGVFQCPQHDDELLCDLTCPHNCSCHGLAFFCAQSFSAQSYPELRFLDASGSGITPEGIVTNTMLVFLNLAECQLKNLSHMGFPNLRTLDLSQNQLRSIAVDNLQDMTKLQALSVAGNPLTSVFDTGNDVGLRFQFLKFLDMSGVSIQTLNVSTFSVFPRTAHLNLSRCGVERVVGEGFGSFKLLKSLDLRGCPMDEFPVDIFEDLHALTEVWSDNYKLCCPAALPSGGVRLLTCHAPSDEISSCDALLRSDFYRVFLSVFAALALIGNLGSFVYRVFINKVVGNLGFGAFVTHLCVSDFLMGVYLAVIGVADRLYQGTYLWSDVQWKRSVACRVAGFLSLVSSEVSAFIICLITLDRFLVLKFPFSRLHFRKRSAHVACGLAWLVGVVLAGVPLLPWTAHWQFYSQNGICIPLPITLKKDFPGHDYSFVLIVLVNFVLFLLIAAGQGFIYWSIRTNSLAGGDSSSTKKKSNDLTVARRLVTIAMSDFLCWFPIGLLGLLSAVGVPVPGEVNVFIAIIVLPVNSAINPFLYTLNTLQERRRRARHKRRHQSLVSAMAQRMNETVMDTVQHEEGGVGHSKGEALDLIKAWLTQRVLSLDNLQGIADEEWEKERERKKKESTENEEER